MSLIASSSGNVKIWMFDGIRVDILANSVASAERTLCVRWNHTNQVVGAGTSAGSIHLQHVNTAQILSTLSLRQNGIDGVVQSVAFSSNSRYLASCVNSAVQVWDLKRRDIKLSLNGHLANVNSVGFMAEGQLLSGDSNGVLKIWDISKNNSCSDMIRSGKSASMTQLEVSAAGHVACAYADGGFAMWDTGSLSLVSHFQGLHPSAIASLAVSPKNSKLIATAGADGRMNLIDTSAPHNSKASASVDVGEELTAVSFQDNAIHSAIGTAGGNILVYDWRKLSGPVCRVPGHNPAPVMSLAFQLPKVKAPTAAESSSSVSGATKERATPGRVEPVKKVEPVGPVRESTDKIQASYSRREMTPERAQPTRREFPDVSVREDISDLSFVSSGSAGKISRQCPRGLKSVTSKPNGDRHVHIDPESEQRRMTGQKNTLYNSSASGIDSPFLSATGVVSELPLAAFSTVDDFDDLRKRVDPATSQELQEIYQLLRYDVHREVQSVIREQVRQFEISKDETAKMMTDLKIMLREVLQANKELREENERLRRIY